MQQPNYATPYYSQPQYYPNQNPYEATGHPSFYPSYQNAWPQSAVRPNQPFFSQATTPGPQRYNTQPQQSSTMRYRSSLRRNEAIPQAGATSAVSDQPLKHRKRTKSNAQNPPQNTTETLNRERSHSNPRQPQQMPANDKVQDTNYPTRMFVSLTGSDELHIENLSTTAMEEIREEIFSKWPGGLGGLPMDQLKDLRWTVRFKNAPWNITNPKRSQALDMLIALFTRFSRRGYSFQTTISVGSSSPRLVFLATDVDHDCEYFFAHPMNGGRKILFITPPKHVQQYLVGYLREGSQLGNFIEPRYEEKSTTFSIELRQGLIPGQNMTPTHLLHDILDKLEHLDVLLEASIPMARQGPFAKLGFGPRPEFYLLKVSKLR